MKAQSVGPAPLALMVVIGLIIVFFTSVSSYVSNSISISTIKSEDLMATDFNNMKEFTESYIRDCLDNAVIESIADTGIKDETKNQLELLTKQGFRSCMKTYVDEMAENEFEIVEELNDLVITIKEDSIVIQLYYYFEMQRDDQEIRFSKIEHVFDRVLFDTIPGINVRQKSLISNDGRAEFSIPPGTVVSSDFVGIKVEDVNFDDLENSVVVGNLVFSGLYDKTRFTRPVEVRIEFRDEDLEGYPEERLSVAWWDDTFKIWRALDTQIKENQAYAKTIHFTKFAVVKGCAPLGMQTQRLVDSPVLFQQKYSRCDEDYWFSPRYSPVIIAQDDRAVSYSKQINERTIFGDGNCPDKVYWGGAEHKGYLDSDCVGGKTIDSDSDNEIYSVDFAGRGNACLREWSYSSICSEGDRCISSVEEIPTGTNTRLRVRSVQVLNNNEDACSSAKVRFRIQGTGIIQQ